MSLKVLAQNMASRGRNGDDMLVHMSRDEVVQLQKLAKAHGLTLTINPETGLPEAFSLKSLLKAIAPIALGAFLGPAGFGMSAFNSALAVGGIGALATGSLEKGLMMGLGAYGGAGLGEGLKAAAVGDVASQSSTAVLDPAATGGAGAAPGAAKQSFQSFAYEAPAGSLGEVAPAAATSTVPPATLTAQEAAVQQAGQLGQSFAAQSVPEFVGPQMSPELFAEKAQGITGNLTAARDAAWKSASLGDKASMAYEAISKDPLKFAKANIKPGLTALYAGAALGQEAPELPQGGQNRQGYIRNYGYDPYSGIFTPGTIVPTSRYAADGGIMTVGYADGGPTEEQIKSASDLYTGNLGREGDVEGINYWAGELAKGRSLEDVGKAFGASAAYVQQQEAQQQQQPQLQQQQPPLQQQQPPLQQVQQVQQVQQAEPPAVAAANTAGIAGLQQPTTSQLQTITNIYQNALGRDPDPEGLQYWAGQLAQGKSLADVYGALQGSARYVLGSGADITAPRLGSTLEQATMPYTGYKSIDVTSIGDEWVRNVLGREATEADRALPWYQSLEKLTTTGNTDVAYKNFLDTYKVKDSKAPTWFEASKLKQPIPTTKATTGVRPGYTFDPTATVGSGLIRPEEPAGETTDWKPGSAGIPMMQDVSNAWTGGGGLTGRLPLVPVSAAQHEEFYNRTTGSSREALDYLRGKAGYPTSPNVDGPLALPYGQTVMGLPPETYNTAYIYDPVTKRLVKNPNYKPSVLPVPEDPNKPKPAAAVEETPQLAAMANGGIAELAGYSPQEMASVNRPTEGYASAYGVRSKPKVGYVPSVFDRSVGEGSPTSADTGPADPGALEAVISMAMGNIGNFGLTALGAIANAFSSPNPNAEAVDVSDAVATPADATNAAAFGAAVADMAAAPAAAAADTAPSDGDTSGDGTAGGWAHGGAIPHYAGGGIYNLGGYSDGGRLLKGPGDGVSDSIPATIGDKRPARLADGEFVIPARIVSELGNGSTDAGARKLYAMMDRIQTRRGKTTGKDRVAVNSRADKLLPA